LAGRIAEPISAPDARDTPAAVLKHLLAQAVAVASTTARVILGTVAFDPEQIAARCFGVTHGEVDEESGYADLAIHDVTAALHRQSHLLFERRAEVLARG
jgi:hypothetical protein